MDDNEFGTYTALKEKLDEIQKLNIKLQKDNRNMIKTIRHQKRVIRSYKDKLEHKEKQDKQHFRKGRKRGSRGRNG